MAKYINNEFNFVYNNFRKYFKAEGDIYRSMREQIEKDHNNGVIPTHIQKSVILQILNDASQDHYEQFVTILDEKTLFEEVASELELLEKQ